MSKAVLVMDKPKNCQECPCMYGGICFAKDKADNLDDIDPVMTVEESHSGRPDWCPLSEKDYQVDKRVRKCIEIIENHKSLQHGNPFVTTNYVLRRDVIKLIKQETGVQE